MFNPKFKVVGSLEELADTINKPHEDYPLRVSTTELILNRLMTAGIPYFTEFDVRQIHSIVMWDLPSRGAFRSMEVRVGGDRTTKPHLIRDEIADKGLFPVNLETDLYQWYYDFEKIHPFEDGNGRVGGIVVGFMHWAKEKEFLAPCQ